MALLVSCSPKTLNYSWQKFSMDGHRTGVTIPNADNVPQALGSEENGVYTAPNGRVFTSGSTPKVAELLIDVQPQFADLKQVVAYAPKDMIKVRPESELSNYIVDCLRTSTAELTGRKVDIAITNFGGIRVDIAKGDVLKDDIQSMLPFRNYICYLKLKGSDVLYWLEYMARNVPQCISGARVVVSGNKLESATIDGKPIDPEKYYGVGTIDFLLDGGDGLRLARNAVEYIQTETKIGDAVLKHIMQQSAQGKNFEYFTDGRYIIK